MTKLLAHSWVGIKDGIFVGRSLELSSLWGCLTSLYQNAEVAKRPIPLGVFLFLLRFSKLIYLTCAEKPVTLILS